MIRPRSHIKVYELLDKFKEKGLVSVVTRDNARHYEAAPPERLIDYLEERERTLKEEKEQLQKNLPQLKSHTDDCCK